MRRFVWLVIAGATLGVALAACSSSGGAVQTTSTSAPVQTSTSIAPLLTPSITSITPSTPPQSTSSTSAVSSDSFVMPNEVGKVLQTAQDDIQRVSGNPIFFSHSTDATGADRFQILDSDWKVCSQTPAAGSAANESTYVNFAVVKIAESCP